MTVAVVRFPRISNSTDVDALAAEPGVDVRVTADPDVLAAADLVILPGTRATLADLAWLRDHGLDQAVVARAAAGRPVLGICGGYQMLARQIADPDAVEAETPRTAAGLGLLPVTVRFTPAKRLGTPQGSWEGHPVSAYEIHHGVVELVAGSAEPFLDGWTTGAVWGTTWHGIFENDGFRRAFVTRIAAQAGFEWHPAPDTPGYAQRREAALERLADAVEEHLDTAALGELLGLSAVGRVTVGTPRHRAPTP